VEQICSVINDSAAPTVLKFVRWMRCGSPDVNWQCQSTEVDFTLIYTMFTSWHFFLCLHPVVVKWTSLTCLVSALSYILVTKRNRPLKTDCISSLKSVTIYRFCHFVMYVCISEYK